MTPDEREPTLTVNELMLMKRLEELRAEQMACKEALGLMGGGTGLPLHVEIKKQRDEAYAAGRRAGLEAAIEACEETSGQYAIRKNIADATETVECCISYIRALLEKDGG